MPKPKLKTGRNKNQRPLILTDMVETPRDMERAYYSRLDKEAHNIAQEYARRAGVDKQ